MKIFCIVIGLLSAVGCASLPKNFEATPSYSVASDSTTEIGRALEAEYERHPNKSAFFLLDTAEPAFLARLDMADAAEKSIDAQYYIWNGDRAGTVLIARLVEAAERGVHVRLLLDDLTTHGKDFGLAELDRHPNIEIRLFNPLGRRYYFGVLRALAMAFHASRMTNRMHNKMFIVDNRLAVVGGRNIGDEYFGLSKRLNFRDMDVLAAGPVVANMSSQFDRYWNSPWSVPLDVFKIKMPSQDKMRQKTAALKKRFDKILATFPYKPEATPAASRRRVQLFLSGLIWADAEVVCDPPDKAWSPARPGKSASAIVTRLTELAQHANEATIISPYLLLSDKDIDGFKKRIQTGMRFTIFTNSMMSTDAIPVIAHYKGSRAKLLGAGVKLYEARADAERTSFRADENAKAIHGLHAKVTVLDRKDVFIGTFNIDPRSQYLNTETGLLIHSPELGSQVLTTIGEDLRPVNSWQLRLTPGKRVEWVGEEKGKERTYDSDPHASLWRRFAAWWLSILPIQGQL